jgi:methionyl-tRNA formyltransferase
MRIAIFGDEWGLQQLLEAIPHQHIRAIVTAENRPGAHIWLARRMSDSPAKIQHLVQPRFKSPDYAEFVTSLASYSPDLILVNSYSLILRPDVLNLPSHGAINIHGGILPTYRGANVLNWVLVNGERETGVTAHYMDTGIDTGDIIDIRKVRISLTDTALSLRDRLGETTLDLLEDLWRKLKTGFPLARRKQLEDEANYHVKRTPEDGQIDWEKNDLEIYNLIRALVKPWPGAYCFDEQGRKVIFDSLVGLNEIRQLRSRYAEVSLIRK